MKASNEIIINQVMREEIRSAKIGRMEDEEEERLQEEERRRKKEKKRAREKEQKGRHKGGR